MTDHCFISYSNADGLDFARQLVNKLEGGHPYIETWFDKDDLNPAEDWDEQIADAIKSCKCLLFVMTEDSVTPNSVCKQEWTYALRYKKPVVPIRLDLNIEVPFSLGSRQWIDFSSNFDSGIAKLRQYLERLDSPEGLRLELKSRLNDAHRDLKRAKTKEEELRIQAEIDALNANLHRQELIVKNPQKAERQTKRNIDDGIQLERQSKQPIPIETKVKFINPLPFNPPDYFQGRELEIQQLADFINSDHQRILTIVGRAGGGKTALACYFLKTLEKGHFPNDLGKVKADGIIYLSEIGSHKVSIPNIYADLLQLLPLETAGRLEALYRQPKIQIAEKTRSLVEEFQNDPVVLLLDNFETFVDTETGNLIDYELKALLENILLAPQHSIKIIITTRMPARDLALVEPSRNIHMHLDEGLKSPYAENILRAMDNDGRAGFRDASDDQLDRARELTLGFPRALESLFAIISVDRYTSIEELLAVELPDTVVESLVGEAYNRLDANSQKVMQALAVYNRPVPPAAIDFLLQFHVPGINSSPILNRLVSMHFARREAGRFYLHPTDREYAFTRIPTEDGNKNMGKGARSRIWNQRALLLRAADYYSEVRISDIRKLEDLGSQLSEIELRYSAGDYDGAMEILSSIDVDYLYLWGHFRLMVDLHLKGLGRVTDVALQMDNYKGLGAAYYSIGMINDGIKLSSSGLLTARSVKDFMRESIFLAQLGGGYIDLCDIQKGVEYYEKAQAIDKSMGNVNGQAVNLIGIGAAYLDVGDIYKANQLFEQALGFYKRSNDLPGVATVLVNLGLCYSDLGDGVKAIEYYEQAITLNRKINDREGQAIVLEDMGDVLLNQDNIEQAINRYKEAIQIASEIYLPQTLSYARWGLAQAYLITDDLIQAYEAITEAQEYNVPRINHNIQALYGLILLRQNDSSNAAAVFDRAIFEANRIVSKTPNYYDALDAKGLALCGLSLIRGSENIGDAIEAFKSARTVTTATGIVKRTKRIFEEFTKSDKDNFLAKVRPFVEGLM